MDFPSHIYIDGADPAETKEADAMLKKAGYHGLDGQTTNPTLIAKNAIRDMNIRDTKNKNVKDVSHLTSHVSQAEAISYYRKTVEEMSSVIPNGKISIQVIGDPVVMTVEEMLSQARDRKTWIPNGVIKFPCTDTGLAAVEIFCQEGPVNVTLNFSQDQAAAVYAATKAHNYDVYISPFVGRLDDKGQNGMDVVVNELEMYNALGDGHVNVLTASVRTLKHLEYALFLKSPVVTIPFKVFKDWKDTGFRLPKEDYFYDVPGLEDISYKELTLDKDWREYDLKHELTDAGITRFWEDWKSIVSS